MRSAPSLPFALLDESQASTGDGGSRLYTECCRTIEARAPEQVPGALAAIEAELAAGRHLVVLLSYELGKFLQPTGLNVRGETPLIRALVFATAQQLDATATAAWLQQLDEDAAPPNEPAGIADVQTDLAGDDYCRRIEQIRHYLAAGDAYQVNFTFGLQLRAFGPPVRLYRQLRQRQPVGFGALIALPDTAADGADSRWILSFSPELFFRKTGNVLTARPMKGTAARHDDPASDAAAAAALARDEKNRAENLMIVDLLRNDLSRLARPGGVRVPALFAVEPYRSVWQMTSTIEATLAGAPPLSQLLGALFPCGSITGAPKIRAMQIIDELELQPRGLYTGSIGWFGPGTEAGPDGCLNVAIRTLELGAAGNDGYREGRLGVGSGIVYDSEPRAEWAECQLKAGFLTGLDPGFGLIETVRVESGQPRWLDDHLTRLAASARWFGFRYDQAAIATALAAALAAAPGLETARLRIELGHDGKVATRLVPLSAPPASPVLLGLAAPPVRSNDPLLRHKTTARQRFDAATAAAEAAGCFDHLFRNERGEITEGSRCTVFVESGGKLLTPALQCGLLPGILRARLLAEGRAEEAILHESDLRAASAIWVGNALRGLLPARFAEG